MYTFLIADCAIFGLVIGSFLNVVIYRVPLHRSIVSPPSACPQCNTSLAGRDNIPVVSWLILRGRCRTCGAGISWQYPLVELGTGVIFAGTAARLGTDWALPAFLVVLSGLIALSWIDVVHLVLPKAVVYTVLSIETVLFVAAAATSHEWHRLLVGVICALAWWVFFFVINLINPKWLGFGDVRLALVLGLALGWLGVRYVLLGFFSANVIGAILGVALIATHRMKRDQQIPYGVFLAIGTAIALFAGPQLLVPFQNLR